MFKLAPRTTAGGAWTLTTLLIFTDGTNGEGPAGLIFDASGALYGTT